MGLRVPSKLNNVAFTLPDKPDHRTYPTMFQIGYSP